MKLKQISFGKKIVISGYIYGTEMKKIGFGLYLLLCCSCGYFQKEKVSEDELVGRKMAEINMNEVDVYPLFEGCDETASKVSQKHCFENNMTAVLANALALQPITVSEDINDTVYVYFIIDNTGKINFKRTEKSEHINRLLPALDSILQAKIDSLPNIFPAQKQGIKVASKCKLPLVINSH